ncbi:hypothetical protein GUITHDRAFT_117917 [Guillardia theta CCMP2712]|uniref:Ubiquitin-like protease family profile domain-containing protein n=1 Tax=Guillardia theta (strain CCMP2712) TaxID=905079 RepID=L1IIH2_GUITC|nr:hypothetical protein GUITHDRAFT_117917 [Guillardia theta CCMP2712]EKX35882.1 hypothetical protein GUITHDRAFT_117917 [Guillardia theta CCMP2712]|eukprot:XP_005822862.1 hypothetical protein GUITHDRAFT_117917 [Guillardia theta CCMP2712]
MEYGLSALLNSGKAGFLSEDVVEALILEGNNGLEPEEARFHVARLQDKRYANEQSKNQSKPQRGTIVLPRIVACLKDQEGRTRRAKRLLTGAVQPFLFPCIENGNHWILIVADFTTKRIHIVDSLSKAERDLGIIRSQREAQFQLDGAQRMDLATLAATIVTEAFSNQQEQETIWNASILTELQQTDNHSCGTFVLLHLLLIAKTRWLTQQQDIPYTELYNAREIRDIWTGKQQSSPRKAYLTRLKGKKTAQNAQARYRQPKQLRHRGKTSENLPMQGEQKHQSKHHGQFVLKHILGYLIETYQPSVVMLQEEDEQADMWKALSQMLRTDPSVKLTIVGGDFNASRKHPEILMREGYGSNSSVHHADEEMEAILNELGQFQTITCEKMSRSSTHFTFSTWYKQGHHQAKLDHFFAFHHPSYTVSLISQTAEDCIIGAAIDHRALVVNVSSLNAEGKQAIPKIEILSQRRDREATPGQAIGKTRRGMGNST